MAKKLKPNEGPKPGWAYLSCNDELAFTVHQPDIDSDIVRRRWNVRNMKAAGLFEILIQCSVMGAHKTVREHMDAFGIGNDDLVRFCRHMKIHATSRPLVALTGRAGGTIYEFRAWWAVGSMRPHWPHPSGPSGEGKSLYEAVVDLYRKTRPMIGKG